MDPRARILPPYTRRLDTLSHRMKRVLLIAGLVVLAMFMGLATAILPPQLMFIPAAPVLLLMALALWMAPERELNLDTPIRKCFFVLLCVALVWPDYVAFVLPGLGNASPMRLVMGATFFISIYAFSTSPRVRGEAIETAGNFRPMWICFLIFVVVQALVTIGNGAVDSRWIFTSIFWYYMFILSAWVFRAEGTVRRFFQIVLVCAAIQGFYSLWQYHYMLPIWANHIPSFMRADPALIEHIFAPHFGRGLDTIRVSSIYATALSYAEFLAMALPFALYGVVHGTRMWARIAGVALIALMVSNAVMTDARSAMVGIVIALLGFTGLWSARRFWQYRRQRDLVGPSFLWSYPAMAGAALAAIIVHPRLRTMVLGGSQHQFSDAARETQWSLAIDRAMQNPFGYGPNSAGWALQYTNAAGHGTVDSFGINLLMDYGVLGFITLPLFFALAAGIAMWTYLHADNSEESLAGPVGISLLSFIVIKSQLSQQENISFGFMIAGIAAALAWRQAQRLQREARAKDEVPDPLVVKPVMKPGFRRLAR